MRVIDSTNPSSSEWHPWSTECILKGTSHEELQAASGTLGAWVHPEGHVAWMMMKENLNDPKTINVDKFLNKPLIKLSPCSNQNLNLKHL
jgi:hypothetical protein